MLISIDPGINGCGVAYFNARSGTLIQACYIKNPAEKHSDPGFRAFAMARAVFAGKITPLDDTLVLEYPQVYRNRRNNPNDLLTLALVDGALMGLFGQEATLYLPHAWKGSVDPDVCVERVKARLLPEEREHVVPCAKSLMHNVWDAVGIGLKHLGRFEATRVYSK